MPVLEEYIKEDTYLDTIEDRLFAVMLFAGKLVIVVSISAVVTFFALKLVERFDRLKD